MFSTDFILGIYTKACSKPQSQPLTTPQKPDRSAGIKKPTDTHFMTDTKNSPEYPSNQLKYPSNTPNQLSNQKAACSIVALCQALSFSPEHIKPDFQIVCERRRPQMQKTTFHRGFNETVSCEIEWPVQNQVKQQHIFFCASQLRKTHTLGKNTRLPQKKKKKKKEF